MRQLLLIRVERIPRPVNELTEDRKLVSIRRMWSDIIRRVVWVELVCSCPSMAAMRNWTAGVDVLCSTTSFRIVRASSTVCTKDEEVRECSMLSQAFVQTKAAAEARIASISCAGELSVNVRRSGRKQTHRFCSRSFSIEEECQPTKPSSGRQRTHVSARNAFTPASSPPSAESSS